MMPLRFVLPLVALATLSGCSTPNTPAERIVAQQSYYNSLAAKHQNLVRNGNICNGMSMREVELAWGKPAGISQGQNSKNTAAVRWVYTRTVPVNVNRGMSFGYGRYPGWWGGPSFDVAYMQQPYAFVDFNNGRVQSWQTNSSAR